MPFRTVFHPAAIPAADAQAAFRALHRGLRWGDAVPSRRHGQTRRACAVALGTDETVDLLVAQGLSALGLAESRVLGVYVNLYRTGDDWIPAHAHKGTRQLVVSLGATRTLRVGRRDFAMGAGSAVAFGGSTHGIAREPGVRAPRISVAAFFAPA